MWDKRMGSGVGLDWEGGKGLGVMGAMLSLDWG